MADDVEAGSGALPDPCGGCSPLCKNILHCATLAILWSMIVFSYLYFDHGGRNHAASVVLIQLVAYVAYAFLDCCNASLLSHYCRKKKIRWVEYSISCAGDVVSGLMYIRLIPAFRSDDEIFSEVGFLFAANVVGLSSYCVSKLYPRVERRFFVPAAPAPAPEQDRLAFRIQELPREFSLAEIASMTRDFGSMVGQGGSAQVFRGHLADGTPVAVKRIATRGGSAVADAEFLREVSIVANVHHRSLVRLLGYGLPPGGDHRFLLYPLFDNGSLDAWLFRGGEERRRLLPWPVRRRIAVDVARALAYLHHECWRQILHLDVKPGNILLDGDLRAHLSDFGISMAITRLDDDLIVDTRGRGTLGYMAPEMLLNALSAKSDVFSYGMTLLELVGGRRNFDPSSTATATSEDLTQDFFPCIVREKMATGNLMEAVDAAMDAATVDEEEVEAVLKVALCCIQRRRDMRPAMLTVVDMLEGRVAADLPPRSESRQSSVASFSEPHSSSLTHGR
ncbi:unnamed protein product [Urochloa humidicola]